MIPSSSEDGMKVFDARAGATHPNVSLRRRNAGERGWSGTPPTRIRHLICDGVEIGRGQDRSLCPSGLSYFLPAPTPFISGDA